MPRYHHSNRSPDERSDIRVLSPTHRCAIRRARHDIPDFAEPVIGRRFAPTRWLIRATRGVGSDEKGGAGVPSGGRETGDDQRDVHAQWSGYAAVYDDAAHWPPA